MSFTLEQLKAGNRDAWDEAYTCFFQLGMKVLSGRSTSVSQQDLEDVVQESIIKFARYTKTVDLEKSKEKLQFEGLERVFVKITTNHFSDFFDRRDAKKRGGGQVQSLEDQPQGTDFASASPTPVQHSEAREVGLLISEALNQIPESLGEVVKDRHIFDLSVEEIAQKRGLSTGAVHVRLHRAKQALEPIFKKLGIL